MLRSDHHFLGKPTTGRSTKGHCYCGGTLKQLPLVLQCCLFSGNHCQKKCFWIRTIKVYKASSDDHQNISCLGTLGRQYGYDFVSTPAFYERSGGYLVDIALKRGTIMRVVSKLNGLKDTVVFPPPQKLLQGLLEIGG